METIERRIATLRPGLAPGTYKTYAYSVMRARRIGGENLDIMRLRTYFGTVKPIQARNILTALVVYDGPRWKKLHEVYMEAIEGNLYAQSLTDRESANWVNLRALKKVVSWMRRDVAIHGLMGGTIVLNKHQHSLLVAFICWSIHLELPMRNDLCTFKVARVPKDAEGAGNWYIVSNGTFVLRKFKTAKFFSRRGWLPLRLTVSTPLAVTIRRYLRSRHDNVYLIQMLNGKRYSRSGFANLFKFASRRYLNKQIGSSMFRKIYLTHFLSTDPSLKQRQAVMRNMQQIRVLTQEIYRRRDA